MLCINIDPISLLTGGRRMVPRFFLLNFSSVIPPPCIMFLLKPRLCILRRMLRRLSSIFLLPISPVFRSVLQFLSLIRGVISSVPSVVSLVTEDVLCSSEQFINLFISNGSNGTVRHPQNCIDELHVVSFRLFHAYILDTYILNTSLLVSAYVGRFFL
jgi:hypothetical protein